MITEQGNNLQPFSFSWLGRGTFNSLLNKSVIILEKAAKELSLFAKLPIMLIKYKILDIIGIFCWYWYSSNSYTMELRWNFQYNGNYWKSYELFLLCPIFFKVLLLKFAAHLQSLTLCPWRAFSWCVRNNFWSLFFVSFSNFSQRKKSENNIISHKSCIILFYRKMSCIQAIY